jgi:hypothetical protein
VVKSSGRNAAEGLIFADRGLTNVHSSGKSSLEIGPRLYKHLDTQASMKICGRVCHPTASTVQFGRCLLVCLYLYTHGLHTCQSEG